MPDPTDRIETAIATLGSERESSDGWQERVTSAIGPAYYRARLVELERQCREDDGRMTPTTEDRPWHSDYEEVLRSSDGGDASVYAAVMSNSPENDSAGIARTRNNLGRIADALAAAVARMDALEAELALLRSPTPDTVVLTFDRAELDARLADIASLATYRGRREIPERVSVARDPAHPDSAAEAAALLVGAPSPRSKP